MELTNTEVLDMFYSMVRGWFKRSGRNYNGFIKALLADNLKERHKNAYIFEFKVHDVEEEKTLVDTVASAHQQIREKQYEALLLEKGFTEENIRKYGFAFEGKKVLIG